MKEKKNDRDELPRPGEALLGLNERVYAGFARQEAAAHRWEYAARPRTNIAPEQEEEEYHPL